MNIPLTLFSSLLFGETLDLTDRLKSLQDALCTNQTLIYYHSWTSTIMTKFQLFQPPDLHSSLVFFSLSLSWCLFCNIWLCCFTVKTKPTFGFPAGLNSPRSGTTTRKQCLSWYAPTSILSSQVFIFYFIFISALLSSHLLLIGKHTDIAI